MRDKSILLILTILLMSSTIWGQKDSTDFKKLDFTGDFRFRVEHDWNSMSANGTMRDDRSRLRYRFRFGLNYSINKTSSFGARVRSGNINDQQGPHVTLGGGKGEFGLVQVGFEKLFYQYKNKKLTGWVGKNSIPLKKLNELFWNDNVFPEGIGLKYKLIENENRLLRQLSMNAGHFIINANNQTFDQDSYLQIIQLDFQIWKNRINIFPGFYNFNKIGNYPDQKHTFNLDYSILHLGADFELLNSPKLNMGIEFYQNLNDYTKVDSIPSDFQDQRKGLVLSLKYGQLKEKGDWSVHLYYAHLQKFAIVDYFAQNDWVRWDYSSLGASGARISNFQGAEFRFEYLIEDNFTINLRSYLVEELLRQGKFREDGNRIRIDLNIGF